MKGEQTLATNRELESRVQQLEALLERAGIVVRPTSVEPQDRPDYIEFGSEKHAGFLGLVLLEDGQKPPQGQRHILPGPSGQLYCLEDELGAMRFYPGLSLDEVVPVVLQQKINVLEGGPPPIPANAPDMWRPERLMA
jgi:hypothetical protein